MFFVSARTHQAVVEENAWLKRQLVKYEQKSTTITLPVDDVDAAEVLPLSTREGRVARAKEMFVGGFSEVDIAEKLDVTVGTVKRYLKS